MKAKKVLALMLAGAMVLSMAACGDEGGNSSAPENSGAGNSDASSGGSEELIKTDVADTENEGELDYTYGEGVTFHSNEPVVYSMMYSDHENYPYQENWRLWSAIEEKTNVTFDLTIIARTDYEDKKSVLVNSGDSPYIIPKTYSEGQYVNGGQVVAISDWVQYMPNYQKCVKDWGIDQYLKVQLQANGKYYKLPGIWEAAGGGYAYMIRKDVWEAAGVDITELEKTWTYDDFYEACKKVKEYTGCDYVISDYSKGDCLLNIVAASYGVAAGWGFSTLKFDHDKLEFYYPDTTDNMKEYLTFLNKLVKEGILDPESFSQDDDTARAKFFNGESFAMTANYQQLSDYTPNVTANFPEAELYMALVPGGPAGFPQMENSKLENGIMIAQNALDDLGEEGFIKMLRFVDWLWYSPEGQMLSLWGVEGETYTMEGDTVKLDPGITYNGLNAGAEKKLNVDFGFGGGMFAYGGSSWLKTSKMSEGERDFNNRIFEYRNERPIDPPYMPSEEESEELNLISTPLGDATKTWIQKFIVGQADIETQWEEYKAELEGLGLQSYLDRVNEIFQKNKALLGY